MSLGLTEIILILVVVLILFGGKRIPELAKGLGRAKYEYNKAKETLEKEVKDLQASADRAVAGQAKKRGRGRPAGSKNKAKKTAVKSVATSAETPKRGRGRPAGSKNKAKKSVAKTTPKKAVKGTRGRPRSKVQA